MRSSTTANATDKLSNYLLKTSAWEKTGCPHCQSSDWLRLHRNWLQKIFHPQQNLCFCRSCRKQFWHEKT